MFNSDSGRKDRHRWKYLVVLALILLGGVGWVQLTLWRSSRISERFLSLARPAHNAIRDCDDKMFGESSIFIECISRAQTLLAHVEVAVTTQQERREYAALHGYLDVLRSCRQDWEVSDDTADAGQRHEQLARFRRELDQRFR